MTLKSGDIGDDVGLLEGSKDGGEVDSGVGLPGTYVGDR